MKSEMRKRIDAILDEMNFEKIDSKLRELEVKPERIDGFTALLLLAMAHGYGQGGVTNV